MDFDSAKPPKKQYPSGSTERGPSADLNKAFEAHYDEVRHFVGKQLGRHPDRDDVVHQIYEEVLRYPPREALREPRAWIYRIAWRAVHRAYEQAKQRRRRLVAVDTDDLDRLMSRERAVPDPCSELESEQALRAALKGLPTQAQYAFVRSRRDGYSYQEIAEELGLSKETVKKHIGRALQHVDWYLTAQEGGGGSDARHGEPR
jgi:RNA polymerase sigma factor (sigma-70 family)